MTSNTSPFLMETVTIPPSSQTLIPSRRTPTTTPLISFQIKSTPCSELHQTSMSWTHNASYLSHPCQPKSLSSKAIHNASQQPPTLQDLQLNFLSHFQVPTHFPSFTMMTTNQSSMINKMEPSNHSQLSVCNYFSKINPVSR